MDCLQDCSGEAGARSQGCSRIRSGTLVGGCVSSLVTEWTGLVHYRAWSQVMATLGATVGTEVSRPVAQGTGGRDSCRIRCGMLIAEPGPVGAVVESTRG